MKLSAWYVVVRLTDHDEYAMADGPYATKGLADRRRDDLAALAEVVCKEGEGRAYQVRHLSVSVEEVVG